MSQGQNDDAVSAPDSITESKFDRLDRKIDSIIERLPANPPDRGLHRFATMLQGASLTRLLAALGIWLFVLTISGFVIEFFVRQEERNARREEAEFRQLAQIATAWEVLLTRAGGDIGKGNALNTLIAAGHLISGADFSCRAIGSYQDGVCLTPPEFNNVKLGFGDFWTEDRNPHSGQTEDGIVFFDNTTFEGANIFNLRAERLFLDRRFKGVSGSLWHVRNALPGRGRLVGDRWQEEDHKTAYEGFSCGACRFDSSMLPLDFILGMRGAIFVDTMILVPTGYLGRESNLGPGGSAVGRSQAFTDRPTVFVWAWDNDTTDAISHLVAEDAVLWESQKYLSYCASEIDFADLQEHWLTQKEQAEGEGDQEPIAPANEALEDLENRARYPVRFDFADARGDDEQTYICGLYFDTVEPVLAPRLLEMYHGYFGTSPDADDLMTLQEVLAPPKIVIEAPEE